MRERERERERDGERNLLLDRQTDKPTDINLGATKKHFEFCFRTRMEKGGEE
jgi:hypothetical protein